MEVTNENFEEAIPLFQRSIDRADFIAIDTEFSGKLVIHFAFDSDLGFVSEFC